MDISYAPDWPGIPARWTSSNKSGVGTALSGLSRVWFSISHGILNEIYYPRIDQACTRDLGLLVADGAAFFSEEKRNCVNLIELTDHGVPAFRLTNTCTEGRYRINKEIIADPMRDVILQRVRFEILDGSRNMNLYVMLAPHLVNRGAGNTAWIGEYKGVPMLFAQGGASALALACSAPWVKQSAFFVGPTDGWKQLSDFKALKHCYDRAENGNTALMAEIDLSGVTGTFLLSLGFGRTPAEAALHANTSLQADFDRQRQVYIKRWKKYQKRLRALDDPIASPAHNAYRMSTMVLRCHEELAFGGGIIASLSVPWGFSKGDDDLGGYHLVWPRDLVQTASALLAAGAQGDAMRVISYLEATQEPDGRWPQNMWLDGTSYWGGRQMDECAFPILLVDLADRCGALDDATRARFWPMVKRAASYIVQNGPVTDQDRWEEDGGFSPFTLAVEIAALLAAADMAEIHQAGCARFLRDTADDWNSRIEHWTYARNGYFAEANGVDGYYVRISPPSGGDSPTDRDVEIRNVPQAEAAMPASHVVSPDALALVRFGLRAPDDPRILNTIKVIDGMLRIELPSGPCWHRYNGDGYGEHEDGSPFDGTGIGRAWPLLTGERAHYELAAGNKAEAERLLAVLESFASRGSMIPEQVWDAADIPERELFFGRPSGSAMPLVWAHAEHIKLRRSLFDDKVFDIPPQTVERYQVEKTMPKHHGWRPANKCDHMPIGLDLRIELRASARVHWSDDGWQTVHDTETVDTGLGIYVCDLPAAKLKPGRKIDFTWMALADNKWAGTDYDVEVVDPGRRPSFGS